MKNVIEFKSFILFRLLNKFYNKFTTLRLSKNKILIANNKDSFCFELKKIKDIKIVHGIFFSDLNIILDDETYYFGGISYSLAEKTAQLFEYLKNYNLIKKDIEIYIDTTNLNHYVSKSESEYVLNRLKKSPLYSFKSFFFNDLEQEQKKYIQLFSDYINKTEVIRSNLNNKFIENELIEYKDFFDTIESNPLTGKQKISVVTNEDNNLIVAGAGSGKTSIIVAKVLYLLKKNLASPNEILVLTFNKKAQNEISNRLKEKLEFTPDVMTFHSLGNRIIRIGEETKNLSDFATDDIKYRYFIREKIKEFIKVDHNFTDLISKYFQQFFYSVPNIFKFETSGQYYDYLKNYDLRSLNGDRVKSFEECSIANFLYLNGINYVYEQKYEIDTKTPEYNQYKPDFYLPDYKIYIEHFGIDKYKNTPPFIDKYKYLSSMKWKINLHKQNNTKLIQTFSYEHWEGNLLQNLKNKLKLNGVKFKGIDSNTIFDKLNQQMYIDSFSELLSIFLNHFKSNQMDIKDVLQKISDKQQPKDNNEKIFNNMEIEREKAFLDIFSFIYSKYQNALNEKEEIDFNDMIILATKFHQMGLYKSPYKYILVDEFQDISSGRAKLLKELLNEENKVRLFCVGDDWQSIYRFAGSDISIMRNFHKIFGFTKRIDLDLTFRFDNQINKVASDFITQNPMQLTKNIRTYKTSATPSVFVVYEDKYENKDPIPSILEKIVKDNKTKKKTSVLLLSRYNKLKNKDVESGNKFRTKYNFYKKSYPDLKIDFSSVHGAKGLGYDYVIVLDMYQGAFPIEKTDDPILNLVLAQNEIFPNAEERRLFYVALTRAKEKVFLITSLSEPSLFITELELSGDNIGIIGKDSEQKKYNCPKCKTGIMLKSKSGKYFYCSHSGYCDYVVPVCNKCSEGFMRLNDKTNKIECTNCNIKHYPCPMCDGFLVKRKGKYSEFWGCSNYPRCTYTKNI